MEKRIANLKDMNTLLRSAGSFIADLLIVYISSIPLVTLVFIVAAVSGFYNYYLLLGINFVFPAFIWWAYDVLFLSKYGTTPGKRLFKLAVLKGHGERLTPGQANKRFLLKFFFGIILSIGYLYIFFNRKGNTLHNVMTGCYYFHIPAILLDLSKEIGVAPAGK